MTRTLIRVTGADARSFLQGLVTNDVGKLDHGMVYAAMLTPQGKFLADFFVLGQPDRLLIDVASSVAPALAQRLGMYRLRATKKKGAKAKLRNEKPRGETVVYEELIKRWSN